MQTKLLKNSSTKLSPFEPIHLEIRGKDASFVVKTIDSVEWGENVTMKGRASRWYRYDALFVITSFHIFKLAWSDVQGRIAHDAIIEAVRAGKVNCMIDLYEEIGKHINRYRSPVTLVRSKLEWYK